MYQEGKEITLHNYSSFAKEIDNLDLIMFRSDDKVADTIVNLQKSLGIGNENYKFSHAGLIIKSNALDSYKLDSDRMYIFESTYSFPIEGMNNGPPDVITGEHYFGVQLRDFEDVVRSYLHNDITKIYWFKVLKKPEVINFASLFKKYHLKEFIRDNFLPFIDFKHITPQIISSTQSIITPTWLSTVIKFIFSCVDLILAIFKELEMIKGDIQVTYPTELLYL